MRVVAILFLFWLLFGGVSYMTAHVLMWTLGEMHAPTIALLVNLLFGSVAACICACVGGVK